MKVEIWSDVVCPWCYIGKVRFERALDAFAHRADVDVVYRAFELDPTIPRGETRDVVTELAAKKGLSEQQVLQMMAAVEQVAAGDGLEYHLADAPMGNTVDAHRLVHFAADHGSEDEMLARLYRAHFTELRSVFDAGSLAGLAAEVGLDEAESRRVLGGDDYLDRVRGDEAVARSLGITGVPFFVVDGRFGISGAQPADVFAQALDRAWAAARPLETIAHDGAVCEDGDCY
jgi:predicted DsbA family dithiol-disulfide isomerase